VAVVSELNVTGEVIMRRQCQSGMRGLPRRAQSGAVAVIVALTLAVLIGVVGLALDLGKLYVVKSELQNSADSCALAAARDLTGATIDLSVPEAAGITAGNLKRALFQSTAVQLATNSNVLFSDSLTNPLLPKNAIALPFTMKYAKCTTSLSSVSSWFVQVLNALPGNNVANASSVSATAVATISPSQTTCAIPVYVCKAGTEPSAPANEPDYKPGNWIQSKSGPTPNFGAGNFAAINGAYDTNTIST
jgi:Putative Flp pilus-assembly TadE/G-like